MKKKSLVMRISNEIGNQMFMYASGLGLANKLKRDLIIDNESSYKIKKNISKFGLNNFPITSNIANKNKKFLNFHGHLKRKILKKINPYLKNKIFYIESKDHKKITRYSDEIFNLNLSNEVFIEGYFESEKYFKHIKNKILDEFKFIHKFQYQKSPYFNDINSNNSVSICLRQNRFIEGINRNNELNQKKSIKFTNEQIKYINQSIIHITKNVKNPVFYLWTNDFSNIKDNLFINKVNKVIHDYNYHKNLDKRLLDMFLITQCTHHIVIPSSFNWWGAWLSKKENKIVCRPNNNFFSDFNLNNIDFWPSDWIEII